MFGGEVLPLQQLQQPALKRGGAGHANCGRPGDERYDYDYEVVNCTEPSKVEALVTAAGLEWSDVDELSEEDVSTTRAASRGPCVAQTPSGRVWASGVGPWARSGDLLSGRCFQ